MKTYTLLLFLVVAGQCFALGSPDLPRYPEIGQPSPDYLIRNISGRRDSVLTQDYFEGHFTILLFWSKYCSACAAGFPAANSIYEKFRDRLRFMLVGTQDKEERMQPMYAQARDKLNLTMPYAFDSVFFQSFVPGPVPYAVWIDDLGIVQLVTGMVALTPSNVESFLNRRPFSFYDMSYSAQQGRTKNRINYNMPFLLNDNGGFADEYLKRSILVPFQPNQMAYSGLPISLDIARKVLPAKGLLQGCATLENLYRFALTGYDYWAYGDSLYGVVSQQCLLDVKDKSAFEVDKTNWKGFYWYSLLLPENMASNEEVLRAMRYDLESTFGYEAELKEVESPCYVLKVKKNALASLKTKGGSGEGNFVEPAEVNLVNVSVDEFILNALYKHISFKPPIINKTGIDFNIDVHMYADIYDLEDLRKEMKKVGLLLEPQKRKMKMVVISDR